MKSGLGCNHWPHSFQNPFAAPIRTLVNGLRKCPICGASWPEDAPAGQCPACLFELGMPWAAAQGPKGPDADVSAGDRSRSSSPLAPRLLADYELLEVLGKGGMGIVYRARQKSLGRLVAVKLMRGAEEASARVLARFHLEAQGAAKLSHPNIIAIYESGDADGQPWFSMELIEGGSLAEAIRGATLGSTRASVVSGQQPHGGRRTGAETVGGTGPLGIRRSCLIMSQVARAVHFAHQHGILHRDLKPANILLDRDGTPYLSDFGIAKLLSEEVDLTRSFELLGTPSYMAPEQATGKPASVAADVYSLGAILYELLTGQRPFRAGTPMEVLRQVAEQPPTPPTTLNPALPLDLGTICLKCLEKDATRRYTSAIALAEDLDRFMRHEPISARRLHWNQKLWRWCQRKPALAGAMCTCGLAVVTGLAGVLWQSHRAKVSEALMRHNLYAADMNLAQQALAEHHMSLACKLLEAHRPKPGEKDLRGWEWRYLWRESRTDELRTLGRHNLSARSVAFSPDGRVLASLAFNGLKLWESSSGRELAARTLSMEPKALLASVVAFAPQNRLLATCGLDNTVCLWDWPTLDPVGALNHEAQVYHLAFSPRTGLLATISGLKHLCLWDVRHRRLVEQHTITRASCVGWSPDGLTLAVGTFDGQIVLWDQTSRSARTNLSGAPQGIIQVAFTADGQKLAATSHAPWVGQGVEVWDLGTAQKVTCLTNHSGWIPNIAISPDSRLLASASSDRTIKLWDLVLGQEAGSLQGHFDEVWGIAFSPDGKCLASSSKDGEVKLWDATPNTKPSGVALFPPHRGFVVSPTTELLLLFDNSAAWCLWDTGSLTEKARYRPPVEEYSSVAVSARGPVLAVGMPDGAITLWQPDEGILRPGKMLSGHNARVQTLAFSREGQTLASADAANRIMVWDVETARSIAAFDTHASGVTHLSFSWDGGLVATAHEDWTAEVWSAVAGRRHAVLRGFKGHINGVAMSARGELVATIGGDAQARLWDLKTSRELATLEGQLFDLASAALSADGQRLAVGGADGSVKLWDTRLRRSVGTLQHQAHIGRVGIVGFHPDGSTLVSASDRALVVWRAASFTETDRIQTQ